MLDDPGGKSVKISITFSDSFPAGIRSNDDFGDLQFRRYGARKNGRIPLFYIREGNRRLPREDL